MAWDEAVRRRWPFSALVGPDLEPGSVAGDGSRLLVRPAILGFIAVTAITIGASQQWSPFVLKLPGAWFFGVPAVGATAPQDTTSTSSASSPCTAASCCSCASGTG